MRGDLLRGWLQGSFDLCALPQKLMAYFKGGNDKGETLETGTPTLA